MRSYVDKEMSNLLRMQDKIITVESEFREEFGHEIKLNTSLNEIMRLATNELLELRSARIKGDKVNEMGHLKRFMELSKQIDFLLKKEENRLKGELQIVRSQRAAEAKEKINKIEHDLKEEYK